MDRRGFFAKAGGVFAAIGATGLAARMGAFGQPFELLDGDTGDRVFVAELQRPMTREEYEMLRIQLQEWWAEPPGPKFILIDPRDVKIRRV